MRPITINSPYLGSFLPPEAVALRLRILVPSFFFIFIFSFLFFYYYLLFYTILFISIFYSCCPPTYLASRSSLLTVPLFAYRSLLLIYFLIKKFTQCLTLTRTQTRALRHRGITILRFFGIIQLLLERSELYLVLFINTRLFFSLVFCSVDRSTALHEPSKGHLFTVLLRTSTIPA